MRAPLAPLKPALADRMVTSPLVVAAPSPDANTTNPPVFTVLRPAETDTKPPAPLVPLPTAMDDHQTDNAAILSRANAGWLSPQKTLTPETLSDLLQSLFRDPATLAAKAEAAHKLAIPHASENLAEMVEQLARKAA